MAITKQHVLYAQLMEEVKIRLSCIEAAVQGRTGFPTPVVREFCYLQLRFLCELIALSCLVAHCDIKSLQSHHTGKAYSADDILGRLSKLRPHFYPFAWKGDRANALHLHMAVLKPQPLPKDELLVLYGKTHRFLHRGNIRKLLSSPTSIDLEIKVPEIMGWAQKINDQLERHTININDRQLIVCILRNRDDHNRVQVATAEAAQPP